MKYLVAYKPCGCVVDWYPAGCPEDEIARFRAQHADGGCAVRECDAVPSFDPNDCTHGTVAAQLVTERAKLVVWLREQIAEAESGRDDALDHYVAESIAAALRDVLARVEGKEGQS